MSDRTTPDVSSAAAIEAPARHPVLEIQARPGTVAVGTPKEPDEFLAALLEGFEEDSVVEDSHGQEVVRLVPDRWSEFARRAREAGFEVCSDVTAVDWFRNRRVRFDVVVNLLSHQHRRQLRVILPVDGDEPNVPSVVDVWPGAAFGERETYDMFGIVFAGNPDLTRILMPDDWEGHPLRKDFGVGVVPVQFKASHKVT